jgi:uncharacterized protein (TIGR00255 family)
MTAFARGQDKGDWGNAIWELRSINHRFLDIVIRLPDILREIEPEIRKLVHDNFQRGKIECILKFHTGYENTSELSVNDRLLEQLTKIANHTTNFFPGVGRVDISHLLSWPGVVYEETNDISSIYPVLIQLFNKAVDDLKKYREKEGGILKKLILDRLVEIENQIQSVKEILPKIIPYQQDKIKNRLDEAKIQLDQQRLEQELVYYAVKIDISEELDRLETHINEVRRTLQKGNSVGRRLDFLMQELHREANTLSAKSTDSKITHAAVEMKVLVEQIREQVQNIE